VNQDHSHLKLLARVMISPGKQLAVAVSRGESVKTIKDNENNYHHFKKVKNTAN
jgi:prefoldin subunit 5